MRRIRALIAEIRSARVGDPRAGVFEVEAKSVAGGVRLRGETTLPEAVEELLARLAGMGEVGEVIDEVLRLPDPALGRDSNALVRTALAPVLAAPRLDSVQISQFVLGHRLELLSRRGPWCRCRGEDGYIGWVHQGYLATGPAAWALAWERAEGGEPLVSLGAELVDDAGRVFARLPWGARLMRDVPGRVRLPDGRRGAVGSGEVVDVDRLRDRFPPRTDSISRTARRWLGAPYTWGGVTPGGVDCSGFVQSVFWLHGVALPRDAIQQARVGARIDAGTRFEALQAADLVFFAEERKHITHVGISLGGPHIIHAAVSLGGVDLSDLTGDLELEQYLRRLFVGARRLLPDES
jgi:gamma-D-glutamyl-L-lysine dipeptidyl-peptidase